MSIAKCERGGKLLAGLAFTAFVGAGLRQGISATPLCVFAAAAVGLLLGESAIVKIGNAVSRLKLK
jgi:hypothetical protein